MGMGQLKNALRGSGRRRAALAGVAAAAAVVGLALAPGSQAATSYNIMLTGVPEGVACVTILTPEAASAPISTTPGVVANGNMYAADGETVRVKLFTDWPCQTQYQPKPEVSKDVPAGNDGLSNFWVDLSQ
jgi:hypothetical protein